MPMHSVDEGSVDRSDCEGSMDRSDEHAIRQALL